MGEGAGIFVMVEVKRGLFGIKDVEDCRRESDDWTCECEEWGSSSPRARAGPFLVLVLLLECNSDDSCDERLP